jgi:glycosyltransferase involved in cell wall biosynthesis
MNDRPLVSILIPCHNSVKYIGQCIDSALDQAYSDVEIIVVDDGSMDDSQRVIESYRSSIRTEFCSHQGANATRNRLLRLSRGTWLQYLDADDYLLPDKVNRQMAFVEHRPELDVVYSPVTLVFDSSRQLTIKIEQIEDHTANYLLWAPFATHSVMLRAEAVRTIGGWKQDQPCCQEHELLLRLFLEGYKFGCLNEPIGAMYRQHECGTISKKNPEQVIRIRMGLTDALEDYLKQQGQMSSLRERYIARARLESARSMYAFNRRYARELMGRACRAGRIPSAPAAPFRYRMALTLLGFDCAEQLGSLTRGLQNFSLRWSRAWKAFC